MFNNAPITGATQAVYVAQKPGQYSVEITDTNGVTQIPSDVTIGVAGIQEISYESDFTVYPNPFADGNSLIVATSQNLFGKELRLFDAEGRLIGIGMVTGTKTELPMATLAKGVYFFKLEEGVRKVIKH